MSAPETKLPELQQSVFDAATLATYFADLKACADILAVMPKAGPGYVAPTNISLNEGQSGIVDGTLRGLQIRYKFENQEWWDTLINREGHIHITRIQQNFD